jgi:CheY-like chemotaxis protein
MRCFSNENRTSYNGLGHMRTATEWNGLVSVSANTNCPLDSSDGLFYWLIHCRGRHSTQLNPSFWHRSGVTQYFMMSAKGQDFELPDFLEVSSDHADGRTGAGSTLPQDFFAPQACALVAPATPSPVHETILAATRPKGRLPGDGPMPKRVLVVDDDLTARLYMRTRLMLRGNVQLVEASSGEQALLILKRQAFDAVLLDVDMGSQNGFEVCRAVRHFVRQQRGRQPTICIITSRSGLMDKMRAKMAGADAFFSKPPHPAELSSLLARL